MLYTECEYFTASFFSVFHTFSPSSSLSALITEKKTEKKLLFLYHLEKLCSYNFYRSVSSAPREPSAKQIATDGRREVLISSAASQQLFFHSFPKTRARPTLLFWWRRRSAAWARVENPKTLFFYFIGMECVLTINNADDKHVKLDNVCQFIRITTRWKNGKKWSCTILHFCCWYARGSLQWCTQCVLIYQTLSDRHVHPVPEKSLFMSSSSNEVEKVPLSRYRNWATRHAATGWRTFHSFF